MTPARLIRAWGALAALTAFSTALHFSGLSPLITGCVILVVAWIKARLVLLDYLELRGVEGWAGGVVMSLAALIALLLVLFVAA
ncbi:cytochrome C oxidase subunit IV family protein [Sulfitobacter sp. JB4-11]|uniref:cytochrome C oxidase subunit IV family protein n=1 Tax=Sulfitobacter rhodophyticola TaxID=3238304 RepID=UPI00351653CE